MINRFNKFKKAALLGAATFVVSLGAALGFGVQATFAGDCSANAILHCGTTSRTDFVSKVKANTQKDLQTVYNAYGLSTSDYSRFASTARNGVAYKDGRIVVDGRTVASDAKSLGRQAKPYSQPKVIGGKTYHESRAQDVFLSSSIPVMVLFDKKGQVETVVINDCGNPVTVDPENPSYSCDHLSKEYVSRGVYDFSTSTTTKNGAKVVKVVYDFGDGSATVAKTNPSEKVRHAYKAGTYKAKVTLYVSVPFGETQVVAPAGNCVRDVTVDEEKNPGISIDKTAEGAEHVFKDHVIVGAGNEFRYKLVVKNTGNVDLKNAVVKDTAPTGINFLSATHGSITNNVWSYTIPSLKIGQSLTIYITATAPKEFGGEIKNTACVDAPEVTGNPDDCDDAWVSTHHRAVSINKVVNGKENETVEVGKPFTYTLAVKNEGDVALKDVKVTDPAPANVQFLSADKGTIVANKWTYVIPELKVGETMTFNITAKLTKYVEGSIKNTACVDAPIITGNPDDCDDATIDTPKPAAVVSCDLLTVTGANNVFTFKTDYTVKNAQFVRVEYVVRDANGKEIYRGPNATYTQTTPGTYSVQAYVVVTVDGTTKTVTGDKCKQNFTVATPAAPGVSIDKKVDGVESKQVAVGQNFVYQLVVKNTGNVTLKNVVVTDPAPANVQFLSADKGTITANKWTYTIPELKVGESMTFAVTAKVTAQVTGNIVNTACVNAPEVNPSNPTQTDDCDDAQVNVPPVVVKNPNITITKTVNGQEAVQVAVGENFTYKLVVKNTGEVDMKNVVVTDKAPEGVTLVSADKGVITDNKWTYTIPELKIGESLEVTLTAKVATYVAGAMVNTACVNAPEVNPNNPSADDSCDTATVTVPEPVKPETPKPTPTTPQVLPNTGAGSVISLVTIVAVLSAVGHRLVLGRRQAE